jgi:hypothetical protein
MHAADHNLGPEHKARWDRYERLVHLLLRAHAAGEAVVAGRHAKSIA